MWWCDKERGPPMCINNKTAWRCYFSYIEHRRRGIGYILGASVNFLDFFAKKILKVFFLNTSYLYVFVLQFQIILSIYMCLKVFVCESEKTTTRGGATSTLAGRDAHICA